MKQSMINKSHYSQTSRRKNRNKQAVHNFYGQFYCFSVGNFEVFLAGFMSSLGSNKRSILIHFNSFVFQSILSTKMATIYLVLAVTQH